MQIEVYLRGTKVCKKLSIYHGPDYQLSYILNYNKKLYTMITAMDLDWLLLPDTLAKIMIGMAILTLITLFIGPTAPYGL